MLQGTLLSQGAKTSGTTAIALYLLKITVFIKQEK